MPTTLPAHCPASTLAFGIGASTGMQLLRPWSWAIMRFTQALWVLIIISGLALVSASLIKRPMVALIHDEKGYELT